MQLAVATHAAGHRQGFLDPGKELNLAPAGKVPEFVAEDEPIKNPTNRRVVARGRVKVVEAGGAGVEGGEEEDEEEDEV